MNMENQLETIKRNLPYGYEKIIANEVGCSKGTVHNIMNGKNSTRSSYYIRIIEVATRMANENIATSEKVSETAKRLNSLTCNENAQ